MTLHSNRNEFLEPFTHPLDGPSPELAPDQALILDFDETIANRSTDPCALSVMLAIANSASGLAERLGGAVAVISRHKLELLTWLIPDRLWRVCNHGLIVCAPHDAAGVELGVVPVDILARLTEVHLQFPCTSLSVCGPVATLDYHAEPRAEERCREAAMLAALESSKRYVAHFESNKVELRPDLAKKGAALKRLMDSEPFSGRRPLLYCDGSCDDSLIDVAIAFGGAILGRGSAPLDQPGSTLEDLHSWIEARARAAS